MKILFIQPTSDKRGHYGLWTTKLCQAIAGLGDELHLITNKIYPNQYITENPKFKIIEVANGKYAFDYFDKIKEKKPLVYWYGYFRNTYLIVKAALKQCEIERYDAIFLTDVEYLTATFVLKVFGKKLPPIVWHVQAANFTYQTYCGSAIKKLYKLFQRSFFKKGIGKEVKGFAVLGEFHKNELRKQLNISQEFPIEVIPDGADTDAIKVEMFAARNHLGIDYQGPIFLFLGVLRKDKGIEYLIEAISHLKQYDFKVVIAGAPFEWKKEDILEFIQRYDVADKVILRLEYISDEQMSYYYYACNVVVFPYSNQYTGGCGPLIKGAATHGKPTIVTRVSDIARVVETFQIGLVSSPCDAKAFAAEMEKFLHLSKDEHEILTKNSVILAEKHAWPIIGKNLTQFFNSLLMAGS